jgi:O-antigen/teichoic acid export membrane protein
MLLASYGPIICLGTVETMLKQVPYFRGRNETHKVKEVEDGVLGSIVLSALAVLLLSVAAPFVIASISRELPVALIMMILLSVGVSYFSAFYYNRFAAYENFKATGLIEFLRSLAALLLVGGLGWIWGLNGAVIGYLVHEVIICLVSILLNVGLHGRVHPSFRRNLLIHAVRVGFPITIVWWIVILQNSVDRVVIGSLLGPLAVGYYGLGTSVVSLLLIVPIVVGRVLYPKVNKEMGQGADLESMRRLVMSPTLALGTLLANLQVVMLVAMPLVYNEVLPKYRPGLFAGEIIIVGSYFGCLLRNGANYLISANKQALFLKYIFVSLAFNIVANVVLVESGWGIEGVAVGTSVSGLLLNTLVWRRVLLNLEFSEKSVWTQIAGLYLPIIVLVISILVLRGMHHGFLETTDGFSLLLDALLLVILNCTLTCFPLYRNEMPGWRALLVRGKTGTQATSVADPVH